MQTAIPTPWLDRVLDYISEHGAPPRVDSDILDDLGLTDWMVDCWPGPWADVDTPEVAALVVWETSGSLPERAAALNLLYRLSEMFVPEKESEASEKRA